MVSLLDGKRYTHLALERLFNGLCYASRYGGSEVVCLSSLLCLPILLVWVLKYVLLVRGRFLNYTFNCYKILMHERKHLNLVMLSAFWFTLILK